MAFNFCRSFDRRPEPALPADPDGSPQLRRANQPIWFHRLLGNQSQCGGGSRHRFGTSRLVPGANQGSHERLVLFQRSAVEELSCPFLPHSFTVIRHEAQSTTNLGSSAIWTTNSLAPVVVNGQYTVTNPVSGSDHLLVVTNVEAGT